ncbi:MAG: HEAT repeat domain-containing protein [Anaerolineaceae bacterium]|nr:HEAT repeat domain-containing protein [Anaerolineaceae bacterium]
MLYLEFSETVPERIHMSPRHFPAASAPTGGPATHTPPRRDRPGGGHVFISYRSDDGEFALLLAATLRRAGIRLWMDRLNILPGEDWRSVLQDALHSAVAAIPVISRGYVASRYCQRELSRADRIGCPLVPVLLEPIDETQWPMEVERAQYFDFSDWRSPNRFRHRAENLVAVLRQHFGECIRYQPDAIDTQLTDLAVDLHTRRGLQEYLEHASPVDRVISQDQLRPEPPGIRAWMEQATFVLIDHVPTLAEGAPLAGRRSRPQTLAQIREGHPRLVLVGDAGSGKTTTLHNLALNDVHHWQLLRSGPLPLLIDLVDWEDPMTVADLVRAHWHLPGDPLRLLTRGEIALYLDGLNEIGGRRHHKIGLLRKWLASARAPQQVVITCRAQDYRFDLSLGLPLAQTGPLSAENIRFFVRSWLGPQAAPRLLDTLLGDTSTGGGGDLRPRRLMARNLFTLGALCLLHKSRPGDEAVENRGALLRRATAEMWLRQPDDSLFTSLRLEEVEAGLGALASAMLTGESGVYVSRREALGHVGRRDLLEAALRANFLQQRGERLRFTWQAQMEYFAALTQRDGALWRQVRPPVTGEGGDRQQDSRESMIITAACLSANPEETLLGINRVNPFLALRCIANGIDVPERSVEPIIGNLIRVAHSAQHDARVATAGALAEIDLELALPVLLAAMREGTPAVRRAAVLALWQLDVPPLPSLQDSLAASGAALTDAARVAIRNLRERGLPTLLMLLMNEDARLRRGACQGLAWLQDVAGVPALMQLLHDGDDLVCMEASAALGRLGDAMAAPALVAVLRHDNWRVRRAAALALATLGDAALDSLIPALESDEANVRRLATAALSRMEAPEAEAALRRMRRDVDDGVRETAREALRARGDPAWAPALATGQAAHAAAPDTLDALLERLRNSVWGEREEAARSLTAWAQHFRGRRNGHIVARLCKVLREPDWMLRWAAVEALAALGNPAASDSLAPLLQDENQPLRVAALRALLECGDAGAARHLVPLARDPDPLLREAVAEALGRLVHPAGIRALGALCQDSESLVRLAAVVALGEAGRREGEAYAIAALQDSDAMVRWYAVATLERIGTRRCVPALRALLNEHSHPHWEPRETGELARHVLQQLGAEAGPLP